MARIFISYSRADRQFVEQFVPLIRRVYGNDSLWFDDEIHGGADWWQLILSEINECTLFVYLISNEALQSPYCQAELREALRLNKQILPVIVRRLNPPYPGTVDDDLAVVLRKTQFVDLASGFRDPTTNAVMYASINQLLSASFSSQPVSDVPTPEPQVLDRRRSTDAGLWLVLAGLIIILIAAFLLIRGNLPTSVLDTNATENADNTSIAQAQIESTRLSTTNTLAPTNEPTDTAMPTATAIATPDAVEASLTAILQERLNQTATESARLAPTQTQIIEETQSSDETSTQYAVETEVVALLATIETWTPTITDTSSPTFTATSTSSPTATPTPPPTDTDRPTAVQTTVPTEAPTQPVIEEAEAELDEEPIEVEKIAFSPDGRTIAVATTQGLWLYDMANPGQPVKLVVLDPPGPVFFKEALAVAFSPDGNLLAFSTPTAIFLYDAKTLEKIRDRYIYPHVTAEFTRHELEFSSDSALLAFGAFRPSEISLYNVATLERLHTTDRHTYVYDIAISPDGSRLASASAEDTARIWDAKTFASMFILYGHQGNVRSVTFSLDGQTVITGGYDDNVRLWNAQNGAALAVLEGHTDRVTDVQLSPDGTLLASGSTDYSIRFWNMDTQTQIGNIDTAQRSVISMAFSPDGRLLAAALDENRPAGINDHIIGIWIMQTLTQVGTIEVKP